MIDSMYVGWVYSVHCDGSERGRKKNMEGDPKEKLVEMLRLLKDLRVYWALVRART